MQSKKFNKNHSFQINFKFLENDELSERHSTTETIVANGTPDQEWNKKVGFGKFDKNFDVAPMTNRKCRRLCITMAFGLVGTFYVCWFLTWEIPKTIYTNWLALNLQMSDVFYSSNVWHIKKPVISKISEFYDSDVSFQQLKFTRIIYLSLFFALLGRRSSRPRRTGKIAQCWCGQSNKNSEATRELERRKRRAWEFEIKEWTFGETWSKVNQFFLLFRLILFLLVSTARSKSTKIKSTN